MADCNIINKTGAPLFIVTYYPYDCLYWIYHEGRQVPDNREPISVRGLAGLTGVQVAAIYNTFINGKQFVCDLFDVRRGKTLTIQEMTRGSGVTEWSGGARLTTKGMIISLESDMSDIVKNHFPPVRYFTGS